jgi:hypothetical protein
VRYSFHGKVRASGQPVDGYVEAPNASLAIDRLADRGIIGVYSVHPEPKPPKNAVRLDGEPAPEEEKPAPRLEAPPPPPPAPVKTEPGAEVVFASLVDKLGTLLVQVEKLLSRPAPAPQVIYQSGPARERFVDHGTHKPRKSHNAEGSSTLRDIFQTNLDLRQSLEKLANNTGTASRMAEAAARVGDAATRLTEAAVESKVASLKVTEPMAVEPPVEPQRETVVESQSEPPVQPTNGTHAGTPAVQQDSRETPSREASGREPSTREPSMGRGLINAQPAA